MEGGQLYTVGDSWTNLGLEQPGGNSRSPKHGVSKQAPSPGHWKMIMQGFKESKNMNCVVGAKSDMVVKDPIPSQMQHTI